MINKPVWYDNNIVGFISEVDDQNSEVCISLFNVDDTPEIISKIVAANKCELNDTEYNFELIGNTLKIKMRE